ncbi:lipid A deacylase LpxR family protein [Shewanella eurypsychrophilus]|uniref:Lipid A deacylase LpxR family protein n=1 Tax=Shewanella eurypsychrophilus TaxID=2593656 RepID=A0ABX6V9Y2_9GAMM|nr:MULTISPECIES: lipid A deacylase LpxR family protein [Shewanella]QFU23050.1 DUF2219 family protein [Shewanella sp. YLB-09]QPG58333.1 lipid A deacylase LpxR family protein [Shewanella eurypsychrophilus]
MKFYLLMVNKSKIKWVYLTSALRIRFEFLKSITILLISILISFSSSANEYNTSSISLTIDNDSLLNTDREYTSGVYFKYNSASVKIPSDFSSDTISYLAEILPLSEASRKGWGLEFSQQMWTPTNIEVTDEIKNDRPYSGLISLNTYIREYSEESTTKYGLMLGIVGPSSHAEQSQKYIHQMIDSPKPMGWENQMEDKFVYGLEFESQKALLRRSAFGYYDYEVSMLNRVKVSNFQSEVAFGSTLRWGSQLHESFGSVGNKPGGLIDPSAFSNSKSGFFAYLALEGRYRFNDYTIDGARPEHVYNINVENWQSTGSTGVVYYQSTWGVALSYAVSTPNFKEDVINHNAFGSLELFWRI